jgi:replicative DNA helicase
MSGELFAVQETKRSPKRDRADLRNVSYMPEVHRMLPSSPDAEQGVLSSFLLAPREVGGLCAEKQITTGCFHVPAYATVYAVLIEMWDANKPIDIVTLTEVLRDRKQLDQVGGPAFITQLFTFLPTAANVGFYIEILQEKYTLREIIRVCTEAAARSYEEQGEVQSVLDEVEAKVFAIAQDRYRTKTVGMKEEVMAAINSIQDLYERRGGITGLPTGFADLDKMLDGLHPTEMIVIAARPSMGKTSLGMQIAEHLAVEEKLPIAVFSLEMSRQQLVQRLLSSRARVNLSKVRDGFLAERDFPALTAAASRLAESKIFIDDAAGLSILELRAKARRLKSQHGIAAIVIDYLQLLRSTSRKAMDNRQIEVAEISCWPEGLS